jgi:hypothetical protein
MIEPMSVPLARLQRAQDSARFEASVRPPCFRLITWSTSQPASKAHSGRRQYSQRAPARAATSRRSAWLMFSGMSARQPRLRLGQHEQVLELPVVVQFQFLLWEQAGLLFFGDQGPHPLTRRIGSLKTGQRSSGNLTYNKIQQFVTRIYELRVAGIAGRASAFQVRAAPAAFRFICVALSRFRANAAR